jgi:aspartyl-tRNA(Asn)/glutamyl-tRNA(Gln) amidotransferase subunit C
MSVKLDEVRHIASLARLGVPEDRLGVLAQELSGILAHMAVLQRVDTTGAEESAAIQTPLREDHGPPTRLLRPIEAFAPEVRDGFFIVPRLATHGGRSSGDAAARPKGETESLEPEDLS